MSYHKSYPGAGWVSIVPAGSNVSPVVLALVKGFAFNDDQTDEDVKNQYGQVIDSFTTEQVVSGTIDLQDVSGSLLNVVTNGITITANRPIGYTHSATVPTTPFQVTVPLTNPTRTFGMDLGVINLTNGKAMTCGATATGTGVYAVNTSTGVYTFHTDDAGDSVLIYYRATCSTADGVTVDLAASTGSQTTYGLHMYGNVNGKNRGWYIPAARIPGIAVKFSQNSWSDVSLKWKATTDSSGKLYYAYLAE